MATHNHAMFASACSLITEKLMGIVSSADAYRRIALRPILTQTVNELSFTLKTLRGDYRMAYERSESAITLSLSVPFGCEATLTMPRGKTHTLTAGTHTLTE